MQIRAGIIAIRVTPLRSGTADVIAKCGGLAVGMSGGALRSEPVVGRRPQVGESFPLPTPLIGVVAFPGDGRAFVCLDQAVALLDGFRCPYPLS